MGKTQQTIDTGRLTKSKCINWVERIIDTDLVDFDDIHIGEVIEAIDLHIIEALADGSTWSHVEIESLYDGTGNYMVIFTSEQIRSAFNAHMCEREVIIDITGKTVSVKNGEEIE